MFTFYKLELAKEEPKKPVGENIADFEEKIRWLQEKWSNEKSDSDELRLISSIIVRPTNSTNLSIIADNLEYFKNNYTKEYKTDNLKKALKLACLCGSQKIADFLLEKLSANYSTSGYDFVLSYACASNNQEWCKSIAKTMAQKNAPMPDSVYLYASYKLRSEMKKIFNVEESASFKLTF